MEKLHRDFREIWDPPALQKPQPGGAMAGSGAGTAARALGEGLGRVTQGRSSRSTARDAPGEAGQGRECCLCPQGPESHLFSSVSVATV